MNCSAEDSMKFNNSRITTTTPSPEGGAPMPTLYIIIASLVGAIVLLSVVLGVIFCRRKREKTTLTSTIETSEGAHTNLSFNGEETTPDDQPTYQPSLSLIHNYNTVDHLDSNDRESEGGVSNPPPRASVTPPRANVESLCVEVETKLRLPSTVSQNSDYENAEGIVYANCTTESGGSPTSPLTSPPFLAAVDTEPPSLHKRGATDKSGNLFRQGTKAHHLYTNALHDYEINVKSLSMVAQIGKGNFSTVFSGMANQLPYTDQTNTPVAIKTMKSSASDSDKQEFLYEFEIMKLTNSLNHENITRLLASVTNRHPCMLVLELMPNGNLRNFLRATRSQDVYYNLHGNSNSLSERQLLQFGIDIASGMEGLADLQLLHRDLAARNVLLDSNLTCKIADFGFAKDILNKPEYKSKSVLHRARPVRWLAPESVLYFKHSIMSDVWSYGIVLWEIVTLGNLPYPGMKVREVQNELSKGYRMQCPKHCSPDLFRVMSCCWEEDPQIRPPFHQLVDKMRHLLDQATRLIDMGRIEEDDDYVDVLPPLHQELFTDKPIEESLD